MLELRIVLIIGVLLMYECICRYLFDMVICVHGYKLDKINRVIKSRKMKSAVYGTQTIYIYIYMYIYIYLCVCVCKVFVKKR